MAAFRRRIRQWLAELWENPAIDSRTTHGTADAALNPQQESLSNGIHKH
jgi:hypothetical protein